MDKYTAKSIYPLILESEWTEIEYSIYYQKEPILSKIDRVPYLASTRP